MKPRFNSMAWIPSVTSGGNLAPSLRWSMLVAACFSAAGTGRLVRIEAKVNRAMYKEILDGTLLQSAQDLRLGWRFTFQQNINPKHTAKTTQQWLQEKFLNILEWPSQRPDLNPIEHLCRPENSCPAPRPTWQSLRESTEKNGRNLTQIQVCQARSVIPKKTRGCNRCQRCFNKVLRVWILM